MVCNYKAKQVKQGLNVADSLMKKKKFEEQVKELFPEILKKLRQKKNIKDKEIRQIIDEIIEESRKF